jgi:hypothetical protein
MMGMNFPNSPVEGQVFTPAGGPKYIFSGGVWGSGSQAQSRALVSDSPPVSPAPGDLWWESDSGNLFCWYADGDSEQWVQINTPSLTGEDYLLKTAEKYNRVVNGAMQISQENGDTGTASSASNVGYHSADQWISSWSLSTGTINTARASTASLTPNGSRHIYLNCGTAITSLAANSNGIFEQKIEGLRAADLQWGTVNARQVVLRFSTSMPAGVYSVAIQNSAHDRSYVAQWTQAASNVWQVNTVVIPGDTTGTWLKDTGIGLFIDFCWFFGSTYVGVTGWQAGQKYAAAGQVSSVAAGATFSLGDVGLYADPQATGKAPPWQTPDYASELLACRRYFQAQGTGSTTYEFLANGKDTSTTGGYALVPHNPIMRTSPAFSSVGAFGVYDAGSVLIAATLVAAGSSPESGMLTYTTAGSMAGGRANILYSNGTNARLFFSARM